MQTRLDTTTVFSAKISKQTNKMASINNMKLILLGTLLWQSHAFSTNKANAAATRLRTSLLPTRELYQSAIPLEGDAVPTEKINPLDISSIVLNRGGEVIRSTPVSVVSLKNLYQSYLRAIEERPILTKGLTAAVVNFLGDILAQFLEASITGTAFVPNWVRLQAFFLCGLIYVGPYVHTWYEQLWKLGRWMEKKYDSPKQVQTIVQVLVDQTVGILIFFSTYFYAYEIIDALVNHRCK